MTRLALALIASGLFVSFANADRIPVPEDTVTRLFNAMRAGDGDGVRALIVDGAPLQRLQADGSVQTDTFDAWIAWVDQQEHGDADEQVFAIETQRSGVLASVWAPFILYYKGELVGCGVNQFTLTRQGNRDSTWKIVHGIDIQDGEDCSTFKERYSERGAR